MTNYTATYNSDQRMWELRRRPDGYLVAGASIVFHDPDATKEWVAETLRERGETLTNIGTTFGGGEGIAVYASTEDAR